MIQKLEQIAKQLTFLHWNDEYIIDVDIRLSAMIFQLTSAISNVSCSLYIKEFILSYYNLKTFKLFPLISVLEVNICIHTIPNESKSKINGNIYWYCVFCVFSFCDRKTMFKVFRVTCIWGVYGLAPITRGFDIKEMTNNWQVEPVPGNRGWNCFQECTDIKGGKWIYFISFVGIYEMWKWFWQE